MNELYIYVTIAVIVTIINLILSISTFRKKQKNTRYLAGVLLAAAFHEISYTLAVLTNNHLLAIFYMGIFCSCITIMLYFLMIHTEYFTRISDSKNPKDKYLNFSLGILVVLDIILEIINVFNEWVISYDYLPNNTMHWGYHPHPLYYVHLTFCYVLIAIVFFRIIYRILQTPSVYKQKYLTMLYGLILAVLINCICIIFQNYGLMDYSQIAYCIMGVVLYWDLFYNTQKNMLNSVRQMVLNDLEQPIILFGDNNMIAMCNTASDFLVPNWNPNLHYYLSDFLKKYGFNPNLEFQKENSHFQWIYTENGKTSTYRIDFNVLKDKKTKIIGRMFVFTDNSLETDLLTGFTSKNAFERHFRNQNVITSYPTVVAVCDINRLSLINKTHGNETGDRCIQYLAQSIVHHCPDHFYFARLDNADLLIIAPDTSIEEMKIYLKNIQNDVSTSSIPVSFNIQYALILISAEHPNILKAVEDATFSMRSRKLMDTGSAHSSLLDSFAQTLLESDDTTEAHVFRTQKLGELLGERLLLSDLEQSNLSLLCLLHDIGKLGIPLEILNKPGPLSSSEWEIMKSHVNKGYRIALASKELEGIADYILHHHEAWDGKGYPNGLKKENIPLLSRIIAVIDSYDAMVNNRPYHKAISEQEARNELKRCAGKQFDPYIVSEFLHLLNEIQPLDSTVSETSNVLTGVLPKGAYPLTPHVHGDTQKNVFPVQHSIYILDQNQYIIEIDAAFTEITGYDSEDLKTYHLNQSDLIPPDDKEEYLSLTAKNVSAYGYAYFEHKLRRKDGSVCTVLCFGKINFDVVSHTTYSEIIIVDVLHVKAVKAIKSQEHLKLKTNLKRMETAMRMDMMTGILNHTSFINDFESILLKGNQQIILVVLDVDYFKQYNDNNGHISGDNLLKKLASSIDTTVKPHGFAGRLGGDEFAAAILLKKTSTKEEIQSISQDFFTRVSHEINNQQPGATLSMGAAVSNTQRTRFQDIYQAADQALYHSKNAGRNQITLE